MIPLRSRLVRSRFLPIPTSLRRLSTPTSSRSSPAVAYATPPDDFPPPPPPSLSGSDLYSTSKPMVVLPRMLPGDTSLHLDQTDIYPTTGIIDSVSMISICLRRREHIPRGFQIFRQILQDSHVGLRAMPEAEIFGKVIEGVASLGQEGTVGFGNWMNWRARTRMLVTRWEVVAGVEPGYPALARDGIKVYQGWLSGMVSAQTPLDDLVPYFTRGLQLQDLLSSVKISDLPLAFEALTKMAESHEMDQLAKEIRDLQGWELDQRERTAREVVPEVQPVLAESRRGNLTRKQIMSGEMDEAKGDESDIRFSVINLRRALAPINSSALPINRQRQLETAALEAARAEIEQAAERLKDVGQNATLSRDQLQAWMHGWLGALTQKLEDELAGMRSRLEESYDENGMPNAKKSVTRTIEVGHAKFALKDNVLLLYLTTLPADKVALITILEIMRAIGTHGITDGMKVVRAMESIGKGLETEYLAETIKSVSGVDSSQWLRTIDPATQKPSERLVVNTWKNIGKDLKEEGANSRVSQEWGNVWTPSWSHQAHIDVGSFLLALLLETAKVTRTGVHPVTGEAVSEEQPAFAHYYEYVKGRKLGVLKVNPTISSRMTSDSLASVIHPKHLPMLVEPKPWTAHNSGGYLIHSVPIMRTKHSQEQKSYLKSASEQGHLEPIFHGVDVLSSTPWSINRGVFEVALQAWNGGEGIADVPASEARAVYDFPAKPSPEQETDPVARIRYYDAVKRVISKQRKDHAERCKFNYTLEVARSFLNETFYLPHNMDFRGRTYPIPPYLSPVGDDLNRGLLVFGEKKALGETGLKWLRIHLANVFGYDKMSFDERARFAVDHEKEIFDSADKPLEGERWWLQAEDPWQCLATCMELRNALRSPDPTAYESAMPVHQDGTCNGMQHYAALGGDVRGARAVNLENGDRPADIYTRVVDIVNKVIEDDAKEGLAVAQVIKEPLGRKIVKQTVMTTVYGVTFIGARDQIAKQLLAKGTFDAKDIFPISTYIARTVLSCIGDLFSGAKDIMEWLTTSARLVSRSIPPDRIEAALETVPVPKTAAPGSKNSGPKTRINKELMTSVIWTTPLGLPVVQPYRKPVRKQVMTTLQSVYVSDPNAPSEVSPLKQASAFPPNFIHSLDATHMLLTALKCRQNGLAFAAVHDSYWTHASTVEPMSEHIRSTFIQLHSQDIIGQLREEFIERYGEYRLPVMSAKRIHSSAVKRKAKEDERRARVRAVMGDTIDTALGDPTTAEPTTASSLFDQVPSISAMVSAEESIMGPASDEDDSEFVSESSSDVGLGEDELEKISKMLEEAEGGKDGPLTIPEERIGAHKFVKFADILPPTPPRGVFDVSRVGESAYFFS